MFLARSVLTVLYTLCLFSTCKGYCELAQVLLAMNAKVDDRGSKGDCTPLMEASSGGFLDIVHLLLDHGADVNAQSQAGMYPTYIPRLQSGASCLNSRLV
jgi:ankyrin repeat protein